MHNYKGNLSDINFWKSYGTGEIDLVESFKQGQTVQAFECKYTDAKSKTPKAWLEKYPNNRVIVINKDNIVEFFLKG